MKNLIRIFAGLLSIVSMIGIQSFQNGVDLPDDFSSSPEHKSAFANTFYSSTNPVGKGVVSAWIKTSKNDDLLKVGNILSSKALLKLPDEMVQYVLVLPRNKGNHFYTHLPFDWNQAEHKPPGIHNLSHFEFRFYIIFNEDKLAIPSINPTCIDPPRDAIYVPPIYAQLPGLISQMGADWINVTSPELPPTVAKFMKKFIWESPDGEFTFWESMIT